jgi:hypothetical protein
VLLLLLCAGGVVRRLAEVEASAADCLVAGQYGVVEVGLQCGRPGGGDRAVGERLVDLRRDQRLPRELEAVVQRGDRDAEVRRDDLRLARPVREIEVVFDPRLEVRGVAGGNVARGDLRVDGRVRRTWSYASLGRCRRHRSGCA